jgi:hypothetical protein
VSAGFVDKSLWRDVEPGTPAPERRLEVCATLNDNGLPCGVLMGPVIPFLSDSPAQLKATVRRIAEAGATSVTPIMLHLRPGTREWFMGWLREAHPELGGRYAALYRGGSYANREYQVRIAAQVRELADRYGVGRGRSSRRRRGGSGPRDDSGARGGPGQRDGLGWRGGSGPGDNLGPRGSSAPAADAMADSAAAEPAAPEQPEQLTLL